MVLERKEVKALVSGRRGGVLCDKASFPSATIALATLVRKTAVRVRRVPIHASVNFGTSRHQVFHLHVMYVHYLLRNVHM